MKILVYFWNEVWTGLLVVAAVVVDEVVLWVVVVVVVVVVVGLKIKFKVITSFSNFLWKYIRIYFDFNILLN